MNLKQITIQTKVVTEGMAVREVFEECVRAHIPALPVCNDHGQVSGRVTLKNILKRYCLPEYLVEMAAVLGEQISNVQDMDMVAPQLLDNRVDPCIQPPHASITSASSAIKALALMEKIDSSYLFVIDAGEYQGVVTLQSLTQAILNNNESRPA